jgi:hypothetical protein
MIPKHQCSLDPTMASRARFRVLFLFGFFFVGTTEPTQSCLDLAFYRMNKRKGFGLDQERTKSKKEIERTRKR